MTTHQETYQESLIRLREALVALMAHCGLPLSGPTHADLAVDEGQPRAAAWARAALRDSAEALKSLTHSADK